MGKKAIEDIDEPIVPFQKPVDNCKVLIKQKVNRKHQSQLVTINKQQTKNHKRNIGKERKKDIILNRLRIGQTNTQLRIYPNPTQNVRKL